MKKFKSIFFNKMPDLQTNLIQQIKSHIMLQISQENRAKYAINIEEINVREIKQQLLDYYKNELKFYATKINQELSTALSDIKHFFDLYSYNIVIFINSYIELYKSLQKLVDINCYNIYFVKDRHSCLDHVYKVNQLVYNLIETYIYKIFVLLTNSINNQEIDPLTEEQLEEYMNLPQFCIMVKEILLQSE